MEYSVGDTLRVDGDVYDIIGKIKYKNIDDNACWFEYRMKAKEYNKEKWLSYDAGYNEYSISEVAWNISTSGYHLVDSGTEEVIGVWGDVDVEVGERSSFKEYEDSTEEKIISTERWDDGEETSVGYYLDLDEISFYSGGMNTSAYSDGLESEYRHSSDSKASGANGKQIAIIIGCIFLYIFASPMLNFIFNRPTSIAKYLKKSSQYTYVTSITGQKKEKADVYKSSSTLDYTVKDVLDAVDGDTEDVQQNTEDGDSSVAILTRKEYCLIYVSEDNEVLVQISSRKYAYGSDVAPYHASHYTHRYYRRYYYSRGFFSDSGHYGGKYSSPYDAYNDTTLDSNYSDTYSNYSSSVRQTSANARSSSGGGISSGK